MDVLKEYQADVMMILSGVYGIMALLVHLTDSMPRKRKKILIWLELSAMFLLLRLDGETWESDAHAENEVRIDHTRDFPGWKTWKETNKQGLDCAVRIRREDNRVMINTSNLGIAVDSVTTIRDDVSRIYAAVTGDQCAVTNIRIIRETGEEKQKV